METTAVRTPFDTLLRRTILVVTVVVSIDAVVLVSYVTLSGSVGHYPRARAAGGRLGDGVHDGRVLGRAGAASRPDVVRPPLGDYRRSVAAERIYARVSNSVA